MDFLLNHCTDAHWNMAHDEFLLEQVPGMVFCLWQNAPAVIVGQNQSVYAEVNLPYLKEHGIALARRVTGGGAVYHDLGNLNYSIAGPMDLMENALDLVPEALRQLGAPVQRSGRNDLLVDGRKCSGYAKRLSKSRMMIHGTLMWDVELENLTQALATPGSKLEAAGIASVRSRVANLRTYLPQFPTLEAFRDALQEALAQGGKAITLTPGQLAAIDRLADEKFRTWEWIYGHSPESAHQKSMKFPCGTVTVHYTLKHGVLDSLSFSGDFLGNRPAEQLAQQLIGQPLSAVASVAPGDYFDGMSPEDFLSLFS